MNIMVASLLHERGMLWVWTLFLSLQGEPYMMLKEKRDFLAGNNLFEGYLADILAELSKALGFTYEIRITRDGRYGSVGPNDTWSGMIGEVVRGVSL